MAITLTHVRNLRRLLVCSEQLHHGRKHAAMRGGQHGCVLRAVLGLTSALDACADLHMGLLGTRCQCVCPDHAAAPGPLRSAGEQQEVNTEWPSVSCVMPCSLSSPTHETASRL
jgi:hypothetical protein